MLIVNFKYYRTNKSVSEFLVLSVPKEPVSRYSTLYHGELRALLLATKFGTDLALKHSFNELQSSQIVKLPSLVSAHTKLTNPIM